MADWHQIPVYGLGRERAAEILPEWITEALEPRPGETKADALRRVGDLLVEWPKGLSEFQRG